MRKLAETCSDLLASQRRLDRLAGVKLHLYFVPATVLDAAHRQVERRLRRHEQRRVDHAVLATVEADPRPTHGAAPPEPGSPVTELDLVQELLVENAAIRVSRDLLLDECRRLSAGSVQSSEETAGCRREQDRLGAAVAALEVRTVELGTQLSDAESSLAQARDRLVQAEQARESAAAAATAAEHQVCSPTDQVRHLERQHRPAADDAEQATQRLLRDILRVVRQQAEPIQRAASQATETRSP